MDEKTVQLLSSLADTLTLQAFLVFAVFQIGKQYSSLRDRYITHLEEYHSKKEVDNQTVK